jgi:hypothetical protein
MYVGTAEFATTETMQTTSVAWNDILFPIVALPLRMRYSEHYYIDTQEEPAAYRRLNWNLLWASASSKGLPPGHGEFRARGVPLVFSMVDWVGQTGLEVGMWNLLWTLGPFYMHFDLDPEEFAGIQEGGVNASGYSRARGYMGTPLLLGGPIGSLVWFDVSVRSETETSRSLTSLHGPLFGSAGYMRFLEEKADGSLSHSRKLLYGILWSDRSEREAGDPSSWHASHGPLWGMIGWGKKRGKNTVRLLWLPIVLPFQDDVPGPDAGSNAE